jgi:hypothetical protein
MNRLPGVVLIAILCVILGCSKRDGPERFRLSGAVTLDGEPIPFGEVIFTPDGGKQNSGPQGIAQIRNGRYDTETAGGKGIGGGPTVIRVNGMSGPRGKTLCEYEMPVDLPRADGTYDIAVPKSGAAKPVKVASEF